MVDFTTKPQPLNRLPIGLLDLFGIKSMGTYPQTLGLEISPTLDLVKWYSQCQAAQFSLTHASWTNATAPSGGGGTSRWSNSSPLGLPLSAAGNEIAVPDDELWLVSHYSVMWTFDTAGQVHRVAPTWDAVGLANSFILPYRVEGSVPTSGVGAGDATVAEPFILQPGSRLAFYVGSIVVPSGQIDVSGRVRLMRLKI